MLGVRVSPPPGAGPQLKLDSWIRKQRDSPRFAIQQELLRRNSLRIANAMRNAETRKEQTTSINNEVKNLLRFVDKIR